MSKFAIIDIRKPRAYTEGSDDSLTTDGSGNLNVAVAGGLSVGSVNVTAQYNSTPPTMTNGATGNLQSDINGNLKIAGTINASSSATYNAATPTYSDGTSNALQADTHGALKTSPRDASGNALGVLANPLRTDPTGTTTQPVSISGTVPVSGTFWQATQPVSAASLPLPTGAATSAKQPALGTSGSASTDVLTVQGIASMTALKVDGSAVTQPVSAASLPLPSGASTSAKQPALGTAGTPSADVLTVQGATSMTALKTDGSAVTQPVSGSVSVSNFPGTQAVSGTFWQATQPVSVAATLNAALTPKTTGGLSATRLISAATTNATSVKASAGQVYNLQIFNTSAAVKFVKFYNKASAPTVGTDTPVATYLIPASGSGCVIEIANGFAFATGIAFAITGAAADADTTAVAAGDVILNLQYA